MKEIFYNEYKTIGLNIAYYRKLKGLTQLELAEETELSRTHVSNIEAVGTHASLSLDAILTIARVLDIPAYKLLKMPDDD